MWIFTPLFVNTDKMQCYSSEGKTTDNVDIRFVLQAPYPAQTLFARQTQYVVSTVDCKEVVIHESPHSYCSTVIVSSVEP